MGLALVAVQFKESHSRSIPPAQRKVVSPKSGTVAPGTRIGVSMRVASAIDSIMRTTRLDTPLN